MSKLFFGPHAPQWFAKIVIDNFTARARQAPFCRRFGAILLLATGLDGCNDFRDQCARCFGFNKQASIEEYRRVAGILAGNALGNFIHTATLLQEAFGLLLKFVADVCF